MAIIELRSSDSSEQGQASENHLTALNRHYLVISSDRSEYGQASENHLTALKTKRSMKNM
jgi:hypothetical protein